jgi:hypothetical protein
LNGRSARQSRGIRRDGFAVTDEIASETLRYEFESRPLRRSAAIGGTPDPVEALIVSLKNPHPPQGNAINGIILWSMTIPEVSLRILFRTSLALPIATMVAFGSAVGLRAFNVPAIILANSVVLRRVTLVPSA